MPIYEYACRKCRKKVSVLFRSISEAQGSTARCPLCDGVDLARLVSRFRPVKGRASLDLGDGAGGGAGPGGDDLPFSESDLADLEREDPRAMARVFRKMAEESGEPVEPEMQEVLGRLERGEDPERIERDMEGAEPAAAGGDGGGAAAGGDEL